jgi:hypothetical protein
MHGSTSYAIQGLQGHFNFQNTIARTLQHGGIDIDLASSGSITQRLYVD